ncbi:MAG: LysR family transcriptional regulator [Raoultibacter sp.]
MQDFRMQTFLNACRTTNYTRTATELNITQPAVSQHIAALEKHYHAKLFTYHNKKLSLTRAGTMLRRVAMTTEHDERVLCERITSTDTAVKQLSLGMTLTAGEYLLATPLARYLKNNPKTQAHLISDGTENLLAMLRANTIDCALVEGYFDKSDFYWSVFCREELVALCAPHHRFATPTPTSLDDLLEEHLLIREQGSGTRAVLEHTLQGHNLSLAAFAQQTEITSLNIIKTFVAHDLGITFLYEAAARRELNAHTLIKIPLESAPIEHDITFVCLKGSVFQEELQTMFDALGALTK